MCPVKFGLERIGKSSMEPYVKECVQQGHGLSEKVQGQTRHTWYHWTPFNLDIDNLKLDCVSSEVLIGT